MNEKLKKDIEKHIRTWQPIMQDYWWIKFSNYKGNILMFVASMITGQVSTKYFVTEDLAVEYINWLFHQDPSQAINRNYTPLPNSGLTKKTK